MCRTGAPVFKKRYAVIIVFYLAGLFGFIYFTAPVMVAACFLVITLFDTMGWTLMHDDYTKE